MFPNGRPVNAWSLERTRARRNYIHNIYRHPNYDQAQDNYSEQTVEWNKPRHQSNTQQRDLNENNPFNRAHGVVARLNFSALADSPKERDSPRRNLKPTVRNNNLQNIPHHTQPISFTPKFEQNTDRIVWPKAWSSSSNLPKSSNSLPHNSSSSLTRFSRSQEKIHTSSPLENRPGDFDFNLNISEIKGPQGDSFHSLPRPEPKIEFKMPRIVTVTRSGSENGTTAPRPSEDLESLSDTNEEDGEIISNSDSDDDIILLEEIGKEVKVKTQKEEQHVGRKSKEPVELCEFHRHTVTSHDYKTLADEEFLNDAIVNFYLTYLYEQLSAPLKDAIHIYSSHFYSRLKGHSRSKKNLPPGGPALTQAERSYLRVKGWTRKIDIFEKRMLIYPICEESHWYLVIVCNPGMVLSAKRTRNFEEKREEQQKLEPQGANPFIMVLDSLGGSHTTAVGKIRSYLQFEHLERKKLPLNFGREKMGEKHPPIPQQPNSCDCGVFLLHYTELIFKDPAKFLGAKLPDLSQWFSSKEIDFKREDIALLIKRLSAQQKSEQVKFPHIRFPAKRPKCNSPILDDLDSIPIPQDNSRRISDPRLRRHPQSGAKIVHRKDISEDRQVESDFLNDRKVRSDTSNDRENRTEAKNDRQNRSDAKSDRQQRSDDSNGRKTQSDTLNVRQIRITKNIVETSQNESSSSSQTAKPSRFSLSLPPKRTSLLERSDEGKKTFEDWNQSSKFSPSRKPVLNVTPCDKPSRFRNSSHNDTSDNNVLFSKSPAESAKRRAAVSPAWRVVGDMKEEVMPSSRHDEEGGKKKRFKLNRDGIDANSKSSKSGKVIATTSEMFQELMKSCSKNKKS